MTGFTNIQFSTDELSLLQFFTAPQKECPSKKAKKEPLSPSSKPDSHNSKKRGRPSKFKIVPTLDTTPAIHKKKPSRLQKWLRTNIIVVIDYADSILSDCVRAWPKKLLGKKRKPPAPPYKPVELILSEEERWRSYGKEFSFYIPPDIISCFG